MSNEHELYMQRCLQLAALGAGQVAPNPMVGAVLVYEGRIIGEGYHRIYGKAHAEVNCIDSVSEPDRCVIPQSVLYVSLEPCAHHGKTPPCSDLVIQNKIPKVIIGSADPFKQVNGKGIEKLQIAGIEVITGILEDECKDLNRRFFTFHKKHRPYIILKWAQTADSKIAGIGPKRLLISNDITNRVTHKWRGEEAAILVGTDTVAKDNPRLSNRLWRRKNPVRLVIDLNLRLDRSLHVFNKEAPTIIFNLEQNSDELSARIRNQVYYYKVSKDSSAIQQVLNACYQFGLQSILVEGGKKLLQSFIHEGLWDEARIITNHNLFIGEGLSAPSLTDAKHILNERIGNDSIDYFQRQRQVPFFL